MTFPDLLVATLTHGLSAAVVNLPRTIENPQGRACVGDLVTRASIPAGRYMVSHAWTPEDIQPMRGWFSVCFRPLQRGPLDGAQLGAVRVACQMERGAATPAVFLHNARLTWFPDTVHRAWISAILQHLELCEDASALCALHGVSAEATLTRLLTLYPFLRAPVIEAVRAEHDANPMNILPLPTL